MKHDLISPTALLVAHMRAETDIPWCQELAELCQAHETAQEIMGDDLQTFVEYRGPYTELRYKALDAAVAGFGADCVMELASGLSPRGLNSPLPYVETDLPEMSSAKKVLVESLHTRPEHLFRTADVMDPDALLQAASELKGNRLAVINEGLLLYFGPAEKRQVAQNIARVLDAHPGSAWLTTDVYVRQRYLTLRNAHWRVEGAVKKLRELTGRDLTENVFRDEDDALAFFHGLGFQVQRFNQREMVPRLVLECTDEAINQSLREEEVWMMSRE